MLKSPAEEPERAITEKKLPPTNFRFDWRRVMRWVFRICITFLLLFFALVIIVQIPSVQQKIVDTTSGYLSRKLNTKVKIDEFKINFVGDIIINGLYVGNQFAPNDTLMSVKKLDAAINPAYVYLGIYQLQHLNLTDVIVRVKHEQGKQESNIAFIERFFNPNPDKNKPAGPLPDVRVAIIGMHHIEIDNNDEIEGRRISVYLEDLKLETNFMNLPKKLVDIDNIIVQKPFVTIQETDAHPLKTDGHWTSVAGKDSSNHATVDSVSKTQIQASNVRENKFRFSIGAVNIVDGKVKLDKWNKSVQRHPFPHTLDFDHLNVIDADIFLHNWIYFNDEWTGVIDGVHAVENNGFELVKLTSDNVRVTSTMTEFAGLRIQTPGSILGDTFRMIYNDPSAFKDYDNLVTMQANIKAQKILLNDIMAFAPDLENNPFFQKNRNETAAISAKLLGTVNTLKLLPFSIKIGNGFSANGKFSSRDLKNSDETFINLALTDLKTSMNSLRQLIPDFNLGDNFIKMGNLTFNGNFDGFLTDFATSGTLNTDLGDAVMDVTLKPFAGNNKNVTYSGNLALLNFDIGKFSDDKDLGKVSLKTTITNGSGFKKENVELDFLSQVNEFTYKNYTYKNSTATGRYENKKFTGKFESKDPNADFIFDGTVDIEPLLPVFRFKSDINRVDFKTLGFLSDDITLGGQLDINITGNKLSNIIGSISADNINILKNKTEKYKIDSLNISSVINDGIKTFSINSELLNAKAVGQMDLDNMAEAFKFNFYNYHPGIATDLKLIPNSFNGYWHIENGRVVKNMLSGIQYPVANVRFTFETHVTDTKNLTFLFDKKLGAIKKLDITGEIDNVNGTLDWRINTPEKIIYDNITVENFGSIGSGKGDDLRWDVQAGEVKIGTDQSFEGITFQNNLHGDTIELGLTSKTFSKSLKLDQVELNALLMKKENSYQLSFGGNQLSKLNLLGDTWEIDKSNLIEIFRDSVSIHNFLMQNAQRSIAFESFGKRGLKINIDNFDLSFANRFLNEPRFLLGGEFDVRAQVEDLINLKNFSVSAVVDTFTIKNDMRGTLKIDVKGADLVSPINIGVSLKRNDESLTLSGNYYPAAKDTFAAQSIDVRFDLSKFAFDNLHYIIDTGASEFGGYVDGYLRINGPLKKINTNGELHLKDGHVVIDFLKIPIDVVDGKVRITNDMIDATGETIYDKNGHKAVVKGGLRHNRFQNLAPDVNIRSNDFIFLNTQRSDNPLFYGTAEGQGDVTIGGTFEKTDIRVRASADKGTNIVFPFGTEQNVKETGFIVFKNKNKPVIDPLKQKNSADLTGLAFDMELNIKEPAEATMILDESSGDNLRTHGTGDIHFNLNRAGSMTMDGEYQIERGDYLFSLAKIVTKNFALKSGGTIRWNGSPFDAVIDVDAQYKDLNAAPYNFLAEYVDKDDNAKSESQKLTPIELSLNLNGSLLKPDINFDLNFPQLTGTLKSYADSKLRILHQDANELNKQVFGLIALGGFLPTDVQNWSGTQLRTGYLNTLSESASTFVSGLLNNFLKDYITGLDVEVGYSYYEFDKVDASGRTGNGSQFRLRSTYSLNDRTTVSGGVGLEYGTFANDNSFINYDVIVDYAISKDRRLKVRISYTHDQVFEGKRDKPAGGLRYRREFDTFEELFKIFRRKPKPDNKILPVQTKDTPLKKNNVPTF